jgi:hypothetical protein
MCSSTAVRSGPRFALPRAPRRRATRSARSAPPPLATQPAAPHPPSPPALAASPGSHATPLGALRRALSARPLEAELLASREWSTRHGHHQVSPQVNTASTVAASLAERTARAASYG